MNGYRLISALVLLFLSGASVAATYEITFEGVINAATTGNLAAYNLGVGDPVSFTIGVNDTGHGLVINSDGSVVQKNDRNIGGTYYQYDDYFYAHYINGSFMEDPNIVEPYDYTSYYALNTNWGGPYDDIYQSEVRLLHNTNELRLLRTEYDAPVCLLCAGTTFNFTQTVTNFDTISGTAQVISVVETVPLLPAHWLFVSGMLLLGWAGKYKKSRTNLFTAG